MRAIRVLRAGMVEHTVVSKAMKNLQKERIEGKIPDTLIIVQHPEVVTIGPKARRDGVEIDGYPTTDAEALLGMGLGSWWFIPSSNGRLKIKASGR